MVIETHFELIVVSHAETTEQQACSIYLREILEQIEVVLALGISNTLQHEFVGLHGAGGCQAIGSKAREPRPGRVKNIMSLASRHPRGIPQFVEYTHQLRIKRRIPHDG